MKQMGLFPNSFLQPNHSDSELREDIQTTMNGVSGPQELYR